jgi:sulfite exporter TauE/SafE
MDYSFLAAFVVGVLGATHCLGMCGGVVTSLAMALPAELQLNHRKALPFHVAYNFGRISSYVLAGALIAGLIGITGDLLAIAQWQKWLGILSSLVMMALGLYIAGFWMGVVKLEALGAWVWKGLAPFAQKALRVRSLPQAFYAGLLWGWLPCGLVYSVLIWAMVSGSALQGAWLMLGFGLGTLPALLLMGVLAFQLARLQRNPWVRRLAGLMIFGFGVALLVRYSLFVV